MRLTALCAVLYGLTASAQTLFEQQSPAPAEKPKDTSMTATTSDERETTTDGRESIF